MCAYNINCSLLFVNHFYTNKIIIYNESFILICIYFKINYKSNICETIIEAIS